MQRCEITIGRGKRELVLAGPVLCSAGTLGYQPAIHDWDGLHLLGAYVTPALTRHARAGAERPELARTTAGYVLHTGRRSPGLRRALQQNERLWAVLGLPVIAAAYATTPAELREMGELLAEVPCVQAVEVHLPHEAQPEEAARCIAAFTGATELPCLLRVPSATAVDCALAAVGAGADGLVVAGPWYGRARGEGGGWVYGPLHSPALLPAYAQLVHAVSRHVTLPIIARGGLASPRDVLELLAAGAQAVQVGSALYANPRLLREVHEGLTAEFARSGTRDWAEFLARLHCAG